MPLEEFHVKSVSVFGCIDVPARVSQLWIEGNGHDRCGPVRRQLLAVYCVR